MNMKTNIPKIGEVLCVVGERVSDFESAVGKKLVTYGSFKASNIPFAVFVDAKTTLKDDKLKLIADWLRSLTVLGGVDAICKPVRV